jgi:hypothetical protein
VGLQNNGTGIYVIHMSSPQGFIFKHSTGKEKVKLQVLNLSQRDYDDSSLL